MERSTGIKFIIIIVAFLALVQTMFYGFKTSDTSIKEMNRADAIKNETNMLLSERDSLLVQLGETEKELKEIASTVPPSMLAGFEDHEAQLSSFIDYLQAPIIDERDLKFTIEKEGKQNFVETPVSMHVTDIKFSFSFRHLGEAEEVFDYLFNQSNYPLQINKLQLRRAEGKTEGTVSTVYMVPAKLSLLAETEEKEL